MTEKPLGIGHNRPAYDPNEVIDLLTFAEWLRDSYAHLFEEQKGYIAAAENWKAAHPTGIADDNDQAASTDQVAQALTFIDAVHGKQNSVHTLAKKPFLEGGRICDAILNTELAGKLRDAVAPMKKAMKAYADARVAQLCREAAEEQERLAEAVRKAQASAPVDDMDAALQAEQDALDAIQSAASIKTASVSQTRGEYGTLSGLRETWHVRVTNEEKVPRKYMSPNIALIEAAMKASRVKGGPPTIEILGVQFYTETSLNVRR